MDSTKEWYKSKTIWASLVTVVIGLLATFGVGSFEGEQESIVELIMQLVTIISGAIALIGRITAKSKVTGPGASGSLMLLLALGVVMFLSGCSQVRMTPEYAQQLETAAINVAELNKRCQGGDQAACKQGLAEASETLNLLVDGLYGRGGDD